MNRWQCLSGMVVVLMVCTGIGMTVAGNAKDAAIRESQSGMDRLSLELTPKLDELIEMLRHKQAMEQHQEQHINVPPGGVDMQALAEKALTGIQENRHAASKRNE